jgi:hypothetical protein
MLNECINCSSSAGWLMILLCFLAGARAFAGHVTLLTQNSRIFNELKLSIEIFKG